MRWSKYKAKPCEYDGHRFPSQKEGKRYLELKYLLASGEISNLELQVKYPIYFNDVKVCTYIADFRYKNKEGDEVVEDVKGFETPVFRLKKKLLEAAYRVKLLIT